ncbi:MAG TPA: hypothetical protein VM328_08330 [Fimbriimonadaceae bacterium]|nr:hypothetical protein [Fimbriimonadaceae bacterium]
MAQQSALRNGAKSAAAKQNTISSNPLEFFEQHARSVWSSDLEPDLKAQRLYKIRDSIMKYLGRIGIESASERVADEWMHLSAERCKMYLRQLSEDIRWLAITCQREAGASIKH